MQEYGRSQGNKLLNEFLTKADQFNDHPTEILDGTISAFQLIPRDQRPTFVERLRSEIDITVLKPIAHILGLYPQCPMGWMSEVVSVDRSLAISKIRAAVTRLLPGKDTYAGFCRALPLNRFFAHDKIKIVNTMKETIEAIRTYPHGDRYRAETFARTTHNMILMNRAKDNPDTFAWARDFWNANLDIVRCDL